MAMAIQPLMTLGSTAITKLPDAIKHIKKQAPGVYSKLTELTQKSGTTPEVVANRGVQSAFVAQTVVQSALRAGATADHFIEAGVFHKDMADQVNALAVEYVKKVVVAAEKDTVPVPRDFVAIAAESRLMTKVCSILSIEPQDLAILLTYFRTHGPEDVESMIEFRKLLGVRAY